MKHGQQTLLHVETLALLLVGVGIYRVMTHHNHPVFLGVAQRLVKPRQLRLSVLLAGVGIDARILTIRVDERCCVEHHNAHGSVAVLEHLSIIPGRHHPSATHLAVVHESLRIAAILVVAANWEPVEHKVRMRVNQLVVGHPKRVL